MTVAICGVRLRFDGGETWTFRPGLRGFTGVKRGGFSSQQRCFLAPFTIRRVTYRLCTQAGVFAKVTGHCRKDGD